MFRKYFNFITTYTRRSFLVSIYMTWSTLQIYSAMMFVNHSKTIFWSWIYDPDHILGIKYYYYRLKCFHSINSITKYAKENSRNIIKIFNLWIWIGSRQLFRKWVNLIHHCPDTSVTGLIAAERLLKKHRN